MKKLLTGILVLGLTMALGTGVYAQYQASVSMPQGEGRVTISSVIEDAAGNITSWTPGADSLDFGTLSEVFNPTTIRA